MMEYRKYKNTEEKVSLLGFGAMRLPLLPDGKDRDIDYARSGEMVDYAYKNGVNYFDTAWPYHAGQSEFFIGEALKKYPRDSFYLASKMPVWDLKSEADASRIFEEQLQKCQVEYFDYYLVHSLSYTNYAYTRKYHVYDVLQKKKEEGKIKHLGFSFHDTPELLAEILEDYKWDFAQIQLNYLDWQNQDAKSQYELIEKAGIPCVVMEPIRGGALASLPKEAASILSAADKTASMASWAMRYVGSLPNVLTVLSGMSDLSQVKDNVATMMDFKPLTSEEYALIEQAAEAYRKAGTVPCTGCRYCMDCPVGVDIPGVFVAYNDYSKSKDPFTFEREYGFLSDEQKADKCIACGMCVPKCPQGIDIPANMSEIANLAGLLQGDITY